MSFGDILLTHAAFYLFPLTRQWFQKNENEREISRNEAPLLKGRMKLVPCGKTGEMEERTRTIHEAVSARHLYSCGHVEQQQHFSTYWNGKRNTILTREFLLLLRRYRNTIVISVFLIRIVSKTKCCKIYYSRATISNNKISALPYTYKIPNNINQPKQSDITLNTFQLLACLFLFEKRVYIRSPFLPLKESYPCDFCLMDRDAVREKESLRGEFFWYATSLCDCI